MEKVKLGIIVDNLMPGQIAFNLLMSANKFIQNNSDKIDLIIFTKNLTIGCLPTNSLCLMNLQEVYDYDGIVICTSIYDAVNLQKYPGPKRKIFYSYDLDWLRMQRDYVTMYPIYNSPDLELWARSQPHKDLLELTWGKQVSHILEELKVDDIYNKLMPAENFVEKNSKKTEYTYNQQIRTKPLSLDKKKKFEVEDFVLDHDTKTCDKEMGRHFKKDR